MKNIVQTAFLVALAAVFVFGVTLVVAPDVDASHNCPNCTVPLGANGWSLYSSCDDFTDPHCPLAFQTYRNDHTGQICKGRRAIANI